MAKHGSTIALKADPADPEDFDVTEEAAALAIEERRKRRGGRPVGSVKADAKQQVALRLDPDIVAAFKSAGPGWQTRMNDALRVAAKLD